MEVIKTVDPKEILYEEVLLRRENLKKEAAQFYISYLKEFGELLTEAFQRKVACIKLKKMIAYCQRCKNGGQVIDRTGLNRYIETEMDEYREYLEQLAEEINAARRTKRASAEVLLQIKEVYYRLAKMIHPDMRPDLAKDIILKEYWNRILIAYQLNDLAELQELESLVRIYLGSHSSTDNRTLPDLEKQIKKIEEEIERIINTAPYIYRFLLEDKTEKTKRKNELQREIKEYTEYEKELQTALNQFEIRETYA